MVFGNSGSAGFICTASAVGRSEFPFSSDSAISLLFNKFLERSEHKTSFTVFSSQLVALLYLDGIIYAH